MNFREFIAFLREKDALLEIDHPCSVDLEIAHIIKQHDGRPVFFPEVTENSMPIVAGLFGFRTAFDLGLTSIRSNGYTAGEPMLQARRQPATDPASFINKLCTAIDHGKAPPLIGNRDRAPCQEVVEKPEFLEELPILRHLPGDGGKYITSGIAIYTCPKYGRNISIHRMMVIGQNQLVARVVETRGLDTALHEKNGPLEAAITIGNAPQVMIAAATSPAKGVDELSIANTLSPFKVVKCKTIDVQVPVDSEIVIEGQFLTEKVDEGPFLDLTGTYDIIRHQPVFQVSCITHRSDAIFHALLPGGMEHQLLMGLPREATMLKELSHFSYFKDVTLTAGSSHWFNAVVQVDRAQPIEPEQVFQACFKGHGSLKNCIIVDDDIVIDDPNDVEFAMTTRAQFDKHVYLYPNQLGSSLDPSANQLTRETCKVGINATIPREGPDAGYAKNFSRISYTEKE
ncbi:MAG TPA: UbiD family decarboxylase [Candidatus Lokiarchaeia archaeon]|nr:UbiD family decarboxylase [Candidatus Lokiarchaeia archaeon]